MVKIETRKCKQWKRQRKIPTGSVIDCKRKDKETKVSDSGAREIRRWKN